MPETAAGRALPKHRTIMDGLSLFVADAQRKGLLRADTAGVFLTELDAALDVLEAEARALGRAEALDRDRLATAIRDGFTHPDRRLDDSFEVYASAYDIADEIVAQLAAIDNLETPHA